MAVDVPEPIEGRLITAVVSLLSRATDLELSMRQITQSAGVSLGAPYQVFHSKEDILDATKRRLVQSLTTTSPPGDLAQLARQLQTAYGDSGAIPKFLADSQRALVAFDEQTLAALTPRPLEGRPWWSPTEISQIILAILTNVRSAHPGAVSPLIESAIPDLFRGLVIAGSQPNSPTPPPVRELIADRPFAPHFSSIWTAALAELLHGRNLKQVSLVELARKVGVASSTAYAATTLSSVAVELHLDIFHAATRDLDRLDDPLHRLLSLHLRVNQAVETEPWVLPVLLDAQVAPRPDWRIPQPRPFESWIELQARTLERLGRVRPLFTTLLVAYSALAIAPTGVLLRTRRFDEARQWPSKLAAASIRPMN